VTPEAS